MHRPVLSLLSVILWTGPAWTQQKELRRDAAGRSFWLLEPAQTTQQKTRWMVVLAHGFQGKGQDILWLARAFAAFDDCLIVAPSFVEGFQLLQANTDQQVLDIHKQLSRDFELHPRIFVAGFSAGAQFSHRFAMRHPDRVIGCAAHAGGSWGPQLEQRARHIPFALSCGLDDVVRSSIGQTKHRVQAARDYFVTLTRAGFHLRARLYKGLGHATSAAVEAQIADCYQLATRGLYPDQARALAVEVQRVKGLAAGDQRTAGIAALVPRRYPEPQPNPRTRKNMGASLRAARESAHVAAGLGGKSRDGKRYWIDDGAENLAGWSTNAESRKQRRGVLRDYLAAVRSLLRAR